MLVINPPNSHESGYRMPSRLAILLLAVLATPCPADGQDALSPWKPAAHVTAVQAEPLPTPTGELARRREMTLAELERIALENNPSLAAAAARIDAAHGRWVQAGLRPNPVVGYHATEVGTQDSGGAQGAFVSQRFITGKKRQLDQAVAGTDVQNAEIDYSAQELRVLADVRTRYWDALAAQRRVDLTRELARIGDDLVKSTQRLLDARQVSETDLLQAEIEAEQAHVLRELAENQHREAWRRLTAVIGVANLHITALAGNLSANLPRIAWDDCYAAVLQQSPELAAAYTRVQRAEIAGERARREWIPNIDAFVSVRHQDFTSDDVVNIQVGVPIPIFDANQGNVQRAYGELAAAQSDVRRIQLDLQDRLAVAYRRYANARDQADRYADRILTRARRSLELVQNAYDKGQVDYLTLITAQRTYYQVSLTHLDALAEIRAAAVAIESQLLGGSLATPR